MTDPDIGFSMSWVRSELERIRFLTCGGHVACLGTWCVHVCPYSWRIRVHIVWFQHRDTPHFTQWQLLKHLHWEMPWKMCSRRSKINSVPTYVPEKSAQPSVLCVPSEHHKSLVEFHWNSTLTEMKEHAPDVLNFMVAMAVLQLKGSGGRQMMPLCTAYGILMNVRCREPSLIKKNECCFAGCPKCNKKGQTIPHIFSSYILDNTHLILFPRVI